MLEVTAAPIAPCPLPLLPARNIPHPERALARGELIRLRRGVYAPMAAWHALAPWDRYLTRVHAAAVHHPDLVFSHESAAALLGLPVFGDPRAVHVLATPAATSGDRSGLQVHTSRDPRELVERDGLVMTSIAECAVDLARARHEVIGLTAADAALRRDPTITVGELVARNETRLSSRGRRTARWALHRADASAESTLESTSRAVIEWLGYPEPELQAVWGADRSDFWWPDTATVGEADGDLKYDGRFGDPTQLLRERRRRDARLREAGVDHIVHWGWSDVVEHRPLDDILRAAGLHRIRPADTARLLGARAALRPASAPPSP